MDDGKSAQISLVVWATDDKTARLFRYAFIGWIMFRNATTLKAIWYIFELYLFFFCLSTFEPTQLAELSLGSLLPG